MNRCTHSLHVLFSLSVHSSLVSPRSLNAGPHMRHHLISSHSIRSFHFHHQSGLPHCTPSSQHSLSSLVSLPSSKLSPSLHTVLTALTLFDCFTQSGSTEQKLKKMALKLKKENEGLKASLAKVCLTHMTCMCLTHKASLAKAEQVCLTHMTCMCLTHKASLAKAECV
jgi:hypothetical protein